MSNLVLVLFVVSFICCLTSLYTTNKCRKLVLYYENELKNRKVVMEHLLYACNDMNNILNNIKVDYGISLPVEAQDIVIIESREN